MKLNPRDRKLLVFMGALVILAGGYYFLYLAPGSLSHRWKKVNEELAAKERRLKEAQTAARMEEKLERDYFEAQARLKFAKQRLPAEKEERLSQLLKNIYKMGKDSGTTILTATPGPLQAQVYYKIRPISLSLKCDLSSLVKFLYNIEKSQRLLDVQGITITSDAQGNLGVSLRLAAFVYVEESTS